VLQFVAEPAQAVGNEVVAEKFDGVGVAKVQVGIGVETG